MSQNRIFARMWKQKIRGSRRYVTMTMPCSVIFLRRLRAIWLLPPPPLRTRQTASNHCNPHQRKLLFPVCLTHPLTINFTYFFLGFVFQFACHGEDIRLWIWVFACGVDFEDNVKRNENVVGVMDLDFEGEDGSFFLFLFTYCTRFGAGVPAEAESQSVFFNFSCM